MGNMKELFVVRPTDTDEKKFMITLGNHLATEEVFKSRLAAQRRINNTDWNLVAALVCAIREADEHEKKIKESEVTNG